jgi:hypothetical protein
MLPTSLVLREFGDGPVRLNYDVANTFSVCDVAASFGVSVGT